MKKVSEIQKRSSFVSLNGENLDKIQERSGFVSLNGENLDKIQGGERVIVSSPSREDRLCNGGCGPTAAFITIEKSQF